MIEEEWRSVPDWPSYEVSSLGRVRRLSGRFKKPTIHPKGYLRVNLHIDHDYKTMKVSRLVAAAFLPTFQNNLQVDHIDGVQTNNSVNNLRMATSSENARNKRTPRNNTSGAKGVARLDNCFRAQIQVNRKNICLGRFSTLEEAINCRREAELKYFGEFVRRSAAE